jgi:protein TonB
MIVVRYVSATCVGLLVTTSLLYVMQLLVDTGPDLGSAAEVRNTLGWIRLPPKADVVEIEKRPQRPPPPASLPPDPRPGLSGPGPVALPGYLAPAEPPGIGPTLEPGLLDGPLVPVIIISPEYPGRAVAKGLEGHVTVRFDVSASGAVSNVVVLESSHTVFEAAAMQAAYRFRYKPRVVDGVPQETRNLRNRFVFRMDD